MDTVQILILLGLLASGPIAYKIGYDRGEVDGSLPLVLWRDRVDGSVGVFSPDSKAYQVWTIRRRLVSKLAECPVENAIALRGILRHTLRDVDELIDDWR